MTSGTRYVQRSARRERAGNQGGTAGDLARPFVQEAAPRDGFFCYEHLAPRLIPSKIERKGEAMKEELEKIREEALKQTAASGALEKLNDIRVAYLGKKGELTNLLKGMKDVAPEDRPKVGQMVNDVRAQLESKLEEARAALAKKAREEQLKKEVIDVTLPAKKNKVGHSHPNTIAREEVERIFIGMGYEVIEGPEVEYDEYNFEKLNIPKGHPARDEQDTFYVNDNILLRSQTSPVQVRTMEKGKLPIRMISPGRVFRSDEVDVSCFKCGGKGCRFCKGSGWIEILGCGMVHPHVLEMCNIDPEEYTGFAFGVGLERIALLKYEIDDMRLLYENDIRFLKQF